MNPVLNTTEPVIQSQLLPEPPDESERRISRPIEGIVPPLLTPLLDDDILDVPGLERLVSRFLTGGVHGLFLIGSCGEGPSLSYRIRRDLIHHVMEQVSGRIPVLVGVTDTSMTELLRMSDYAAEQGATAVVMAGPCYFPIDEKDFMQYLEKVADRLPIPAFLYNMPTHTKLWFTIPIIERLMGHPSIVGLKDSSCNMDYFRQVSELMARWPKKSLLIGSDAHLPEGLAAGGHGGVCGGANLLPRLFTDIYEAHKTGDEQKMAKCKSRLKELHTLYNGFEGATFLNTMKAALSILGVCNNCFAEPLHALDDEGKEKVKNILDKLHIDKTTLD